jgi:hypothetical protein
MDGGGEMDVQKKCMSGDFFFENDCLKRASGSAEALAA